MICQISQRVIHHKKRLNIDEKIKVGENVSAIIQRKLTQKRKDQGMFAIPYAIGNCKLEKAMLDLGALINVMSLSIYKDLNLEPLKETNVIIQLVDRSNSYPEGVVKDVLIGVNKLIFPLIFTLLTWMMTVARRKNPARRPLPGDGGFFSLLLELIFFGVAT
jgi:hypothetical protein